MKMLVANWKMQLTVKASVALAKAVKGSANVVVCPSFPALESVGETLKGGKAKLGAQDVFFEAEGPFTGEVSPAQLKDVGCSFVIVGHSERRALGETDATVNKKVIASLEAGLTPIICVGESKAQRKAGKANAVVEKQVKAALHDLHTRHQEKIIFAYEPVWAIGTGDAAMPSDAVEMHTLIRRTAGRAIKGIKASQIKVLYGGSVNEKNAGDFLTESAVDGVLVGGASLKVKSLLAIIDL